jgi:hypothetical protein
MSEPRKFHYLRSLVPVVEKILLLQALLDTKEAAIQAAEVELASTPTGYKQTIARCKLREAEESRDATLNEMTALIEKTPDPAELLGSCYVQRIAELRVERSGVQANIDKNAVLLDSELEALKSGPWRRKDAPMPSTILRLQATESNLRAKIININRQISELVPDMDEIDSLTKDSEEVYHWANDPDAPTPQRVLDRQRREHEEFLKDCVVLKLPKRVVT